MKVDEYVNLLMPTLRNLGMSETMWDAQKLERLLGRHDDPTGYTLGHVSLLQPINDSYRRELIALNGPHAKTVLKIIRIKKGLANEEV